MGQSLMASAGENAGGLVLDYLGYAADVGSDGWHAGHGRFDERSRHSLVVGGEQDEVSGRVDGLHVGPPAEHRDAAVTVTGRMHYVRGEITTAADEEPGRG